MQLRDWMKVLDHHKKRINDIIAKMKELNESKELSAYVEHIYDRVKQWTPQDTKDHAKIDALQRTVLISAVEKQIEHDLGKLGLKFKDVSAKVDSITNGLWIYLSESSEIQKFLEYLGTRRIILTQRYRFNSQQVEYLIKIIFSSRPDIRAKAKLDLFSRTE